MKKVLIIKKNNNKGTALFCVQKIQQIKVLQAKIVLSYNLAKTWNSAVKTRFQFFCKKIDKVDKIDTTVAPVKTIKVVHFLGGGTDPLLTQRFVFAVHMLNP